MNGSFCCDRMTDDDQVRMLEAHLEPQRLEDSLRRCSGMDIRLLKNNGLLDYHYDFSASSEMIFTTETGREGIRIHHYLENIDDMRDLVSVEHDLSSGRYWDAIRKASSIDP